MILYASVVRDNSGIRAVVFHVPMDVTAVAAITARRKVASISLQITLFDLRVGFSFMCGAGRLRMRARKKDVNYTSTCPMVH